MAGLWIFQSWRESHRTIETKEYHNVYVTGVEGRKLKGIWKGKECQWELISEIGEQSVAGVADLVFKEGKITKIKKKPDTIQGKILRISDQILQIENYGDIRLEKDFKLYHIAAEGTVTQGEFNELSVGYADVRYVVAKGEICAALVGETKLANIRVILKDAENKSYDFSSVTISATTDYTVTTGKEKKQFSSSEKQTWSAEQVKDHLVIDTGGKGKIRVENIKRQYGMPEYRGTLEIDRADKSLHIINELSLEEYLYSVVPSEMPTEYGEEALKAQAVCARSYAVEQMKGKKLAKWGAHVDDSVSFQVYNNLREDEKSIAAVNATKDQVVTCQNQVATTYFYSVSCGISAGIKDVWFAERDVDYLSSVLQNEKRENRELAQEKKFQSFLKKEQNTYDAQSPWYRWKTTIQGKELEESIRDGAKERYAANPTQIQTKQKDGTYKSTGETEIGTLKGIRIIQRGQSGVARMAEIEGSDNTLHVYTEYNIRFLLIGKKAVFQRRDKKEVTGLSCLPSGFFLIEKKGDSYIFTGGGYGHGVGMSQNGANEMAAQGKNYQEILKFYFPRTNVESRESV